MFENVQFFRICILRIQKVLLWPKKFFSWKISMWVSKNAEFYAGFQKCPQQKLKAKNHEKMHKIENTQNLHSFLALAFFRGICLSRHQRIWNQHKILRFFYTHIDIFQEKNFWFIIVLFGFLKCKCETNCTFSDILQKVNSYFFANIYHSPCDSH